MDQEGGRPLQLRTHYEREEELGGACFLESPPSRGSHWGTRWAAGVGWGGLWKSITTGWNLSQGCFEKGAGLCGGGQRAEVGLGLLILTLMGCVLCGPAAGASLPAL